MTSRSTRPAAAFGLAALGALALRYPFYAFLLHFAKKGGHDPLRENFVSWCMWDCGHYTQLADEGYTGADVAFFPGFPLLARALRLLTGVTAQASTILLSNLFCLAAIACLVLLGGELAKRGKRTTGFGWVLAATAAFFPTNHFWSSGYAESLFVLCSIGLFWALFRERWWPAALCAALLGVSRNQGLWITGLFCLALGWEAFAPRFRLRRFTRLKTTEALALGLVAALPTLVFLGWQWAETGDPLRFMHVLTKDWNRGFRLTEVLRYHLPRFDFSYALLVLAWVASVRFIRRPGPFWKFLALVTWVLAILPLGVGGFSSGYGRYQGASLGLLLLIAELVEARIWLQLPVFGWMLFRLAVEIEGWTAGQWRG